VREEPDKRKWMRFKEQGTKASETPGMILFLRKASKDLRDFLGAEKKRREPPWKRNQLTRTAN
jgi:hypothetical protein